MKSAPKISADKLTLSGDKVFFSIQGEGASIGYPAVFLRLHMCNLDCVWCDTPYTWDKNSEEYWSEWQQLSINETKSLVCAHDCRRLVITGGEPLLQQAALSMLIKELPDWDVEFETNGTVAPDNYLLERCQFNVSPKLGNSKILEERRLKKDVLRIFAVNANSYFKFVVENSADLEEIDLLVSEVGLDKSKVIIMPQGKVPQDLSVRMQELAEVVKIKGYRLLPRLHVYIWGNLRAV
jgi:7-carboxy-7-deazaguanine synthase